MKLSALATQTRLAANTSHRAAVVVLVLLHAVLRLWIRWPLVDALETSASYL